MKSLLMPKNVEKSPLKGGVVNLYNIDIIYDVYINKECA